MQLRGLAEDVEAAKQALLALDIISNTRRLQGKEYSTLVGKSGATINKFVEDHQVMIDIDEVREEEWLATITGPPANVESCFVDIEHVLAMNREVVEKLSVDPIVRNSLLIDSGAPIKKLQFEINERVKPMGGQVMVAFNKEQTDDSKSVLMIKGRYAAVMVAREMVQEMISEVERSLVIIDVDPFIVPRIIGKGGETIKKLRNGNAVNIEVDKVIGRVVIQSPDDAEVKRVEAELNAIITENQLERIEFQQSVVKPLFRELSRSEDKAKIAALVWMGLDEDTNQITLRGTRENVSSLLRFLCLLLALI